MTMTTDHELTFQQKGLFQQGYQHYSPDELRQLEWGLRFTPGVCAAITAVALYLQEPIALFVVAFLGMYAFFFPAGHPMDLIYNHGVRHLFGAVALPENPLPRRMACLAAGVMNSAAAFLFLADMPLAAIVVGVTLLCLQVIVITTHFCTLSFIYEYLLRALGYWENPIDLAKAKELLGDGAVVVDVRSSNEYADNTQQNSVNLPLESLDDNVEELRKIKSLLLVCKSGTRSHIALEKLRKHGFKNAYNLGPMSRVSELYVASE
jgi:rhodanese-related sulfurtransferase